MTRSALAGLIAATFLSACAVTPTAPEVSPALARALDSEPDGYRAVMPATGQRFEIVSTSASRDTLCRVVSVEQPDTFTVDSYCKTKGSMWR